MPADNLTKFIHKITGPVLWLGVFSALMLWLLDAVLVNSTNSQSQVFVSVLFSEWMRRSVIAFTLIGLSGYAQFRVNSSLSPNLSFDDFLSEQRALLGNVLIAYLIVRGNKILRVNDFVEQMLGWSPAECVGHRFDRDQTTD